MRERRLWFPTSGRLETSSPPERPGLDNITSQPWSEATCPCTTSTSAYLRFVTIFSLKKTRQSTRSGGTGASCVRLWLTRVVSRPVRSGGDKPGFLSFEVIGCRAKRRSLNTRLSSGTSAGTLQCPQALTEIIMPKQVRKTNRDMFLVPFQKKGWKIDHHVSNLRTRGFLFQGVQVHPYIFLHDS